MQCPQYCTLCDLRANTLFSVCCPGSLAQDISSIYCCKQRTADAPLEPTLGNEQQIVALQESKAAHDTISLQTAGQWSIKATIEHHSRLLWREEHAHLMGM